MYINRGITWKAGAWFSSGNFPSRMIEHVIFLVTSLDGGSGSQGINGSYCSWFRNPVNSPVELRLVVEIYHYLQGELYIQTVVGCLGFLNHQQYQVIQPPWPNPTADSLFGAGSLFKRLSSSRILKGHVFTTPKKSQLQKCQVYLFHSPDVICKILLPRLLWKRCPNWPWHLMDVQRLRIV